MWIGKGKNIVTLHITIIVHHQDQSEICVLMSSVQNLFSFNIFFPGRWPHWESLLIQFTAESSSILFASKEWMGILMCGSFLSSWIQGLLPSLFRGRYLDSLNMVWSQERSWPNRETKCLVCWLFESKLEDRWHVGRNNSGLCSQLDNVTYSKIVHPFFLICLLQREVSRVASNLGWQNPWRKDCL